MSTNCKYARFFHGEFGLRSTVTQEWFHNSHGNVFHTPSNKVANAQLAFVAPEYRVEQFEAKARTSRELAQMVSNPDTIPFPSGRGNPTDPKAA